MISNTSKLAIRFTPTATGIFLFVFVVVSLWLIFQYAEKQRNRDILNWQSRLALLAEIRTDAVESWIGQRRKQLQDLAENPSLRLFLSEYKNNVSTDNPVLNAQQAHVRNLLSASAERFGFTTTTGKLNLNKSSLYGLALISHQKQLMMSTKGLSIDLVKYQSDIEKVFNTARAQIIDLHSSDNQQPVYGYILPVFQIQDIQSSNAIGAVMIMLNPYETLYEILKNKQSVTKTDETLLVKQSGPSLVFISPLTESYKLFLQLPDNNRLASSVAFHNPGSFSQLTDYKGEEVLVTSRKIKNTPWRLIQKITANEALEESKKHQTFLLSTFSLFVLFVAAAFVAIWRHSTSIRLKTLSETLETRTALLDAVSDNIKENIVLIDKGNKIIFINPAFAKLLSLDEDEIVSKHIGSILSTQDVEQLQNISTGKNASQVMTLSLNKDACVYHVNSTTLSSGEHKQAVLYVLHDISELKREQEKREQLGRGIISTLVKAVDLHDPYCRNHSERTREVAVEIGSELGLSNEQLETLEMAALLANIGKLFVPKEILTKMDALSEEESLQLKKHIDYAVDILSELSFNGPVVDIIEQKNERLDGSGYPRGLAAEAILQESRILAVANAFVAMASSRAYRQGRAVNEVVDILLEQSDTQYDRHVVAALFHIAENKANWKTWQDVSEE